MSWNLHEHQMQQEPPATSEISWNGMNGYALITSMHTREATERSQEPKNEWPKKTLSLENASVQTNRTSKLQKQQIFNTADGMA
jgi:hypothetical protein